MLLRFFSAAAVVMLLASPLKAAQCTQDMEKIDAALATNPEMDGAMKVQVMDLRNEGEALHNQGNHEESVAVLSQAKELLGISD